MRPFTPPSFRASAFHCPHCDAYANQLWTREKGGNNVYHYTHLLGKDETRIIVGLTAAECMHCHKYTFWINEKLAYPEILSLPKPNDDLMEDIKQDYLEARSIFNRSPKGAAALLRLCVQKMCQQLRLPGRNINDDIAALVQRGLPAQIQQALDIVRVVGNNAVHPGQMDLNDTPETAQRLFELVNLIANVMLTQPREINQLYQSLPQSARDGITRGDRNRNNQA